MKNNKQGYFSPALEDYHQHPRLPALFFLPSYLHLPLPGPTASEHWYMQEPGGREAALPQGKGKGAVRSS